MTTLQAPAKLTLTLTITDVRADGYHLIDAEMVALQLSDVITITDSDTTSITVSGQYAHGVPTDHSNLVHAALNLVSRTAHVHIEKNIPHGGGLGGGSTDAAAILRWANFTNHHDAAGLGADIPFSMVGGRAQVTGIGDIVTPLPFIERDITLFVPPLHVSTPRVYAQWDAMGGPHGDFGNDLEPAACAAFPELAQWRDRIAEAFGIRPHLAGSGATWFAHGHLQAETPEGLVVVHTTTRPDSGRVVRER